jgi:hypothetical protein
MENLPTNAVGQRSTVPLFLRNLGPTMKEIVDTLVGGEPEISAYIIVYRKPVFGINFHTVSRGKQNLKIGTLA